jgi:hypothetical protein
MLSSSVFMVFSAMVATTTAYTIPDSCGLGDIDVPTTCTDDVPDSLAADITSLKCSFKLYLELNGKRNYFGIGVWERDDDPSANPDPETGLLTANSNRQPSVLTLESGRARSSSRYISKSKEGTPYGAESTLYLTRDVGILELTKYQDLQTEVRMNFECINVEPRLVLLAPPGMYCCKGIHSATCHAQSLIVLRRVLLHRHQWHQQ